MLPAPITNQKERTDLVPMSTEEVWQWADGQSAFFINISGNMMSPKCAYYSFNNQNCISVSCRETANGKTTFHFICEFDQTKSLPQAPPKQKVNYTIPAIGVTLEKRNPEAVSWTFPVVRCSSGHVIRDFFSCDAQSGCVDDATVDWCESGGVSVPMFACRQRGLTLPYTLVCDRIQHCPDKSDEDFCVLDPCPVAAWRCKNGQCVDRKLVCNRRPDCYDGSDETCQIILGWSKLKELPLPVVVDFDGKGSYQLRSMNPTVGCPDTHFYCPEGVCLPVYLRCNNIADCLGKEDEKYCDKYSCPGFYRCRGSRVCLHQKFLCDRVLHCPQQDDELLCHLRCPATCYCRGLAFVCSHKFNAGSYPDLRFLDASGSDMVLENLANNSFLIRLHLCRCGISAVNIMALPNLQHLNLSQNQLVNIDMQSFSRLGNLRVVDLSSNPLSVLINSDVTEANLLILESIDLSFTMLNVLDGLAFANCPQLTNINVSWSKLSTINDQGFKSTPLLACLDARGSPLTSFPTDVLTSLKALKTVYVDNYKLCCEAMLPPDFVIRNCHSKQDLLASCEYLLKSNTYRTFLWVFASLAIVGNVGSFVGRIYLDKSGGNSFGVFVTNLCLADFFMGVYLAIIGTADLVYHGHYLFNDVQWKHSTACSVAGFLSLLSCEAGTFIICLITLDRFLVLRFPFSQIHFGRHSALITCGIIWTVCLVLAFIPLLPATSHWQFFSQNGICIPLPFTSSDNFPGHTYSFTVIIVINFVLFLLIAIGQAFVYWSVLANSIVSSNKDTAARDFKIARRLITIVLSDFACWFPIGLLGILASTGTVIPDEVNVAVAIFVLPFNAALNPYLYTFNVVMEKRQKAREAYLMKKLQMRMNTMTEIGFDTELSSKICSSVSKAATLAQIKAWVKDKVVTQEEVSSCWS